MAYWDEGSEGRILGQGKELSKHVAFGARTVGFGRLPAQYQNSPGDLGLLVWEGVLVRLSRETESIGCVYACRKRFIIKNWLMKLWKLVSSQSVLHTSKPRQAV